MEQENNVVVFDGFCGLCNGSIDILMKLDKKRQLRYTTLQGKYIKNLDVHPKIDSIIYIQNVKLYYKSTAILKILQDLGGFWVLTNIFYLIPEKLRDFLYDIIAQHRYKIFGKMDTCRIPTKSEAVLFID